MSGTRAISTTSRRELSKFFFLQSKAPKQTHAIPTETVACFLPGRAKDLSAPLYYLPTSVCLFWRDSPYSTSASSFTRFLDHTQRRTRVGRIPLDEWTAWHRDLYLTTHNNQNRRISMPPGVIRNHNLSRRASLHLCLWPQGYWDLPTSVCNA